MTTFYQQNTSFEFKFKHITKQWLKDVVSSENRIIGDISIIFCDDSYILDINNKYLQHNYYTDIITFDYCEGDKLSGDLFISIDTVKDNSLSYNTSFDNELFRVIVHGVLHLAGYDDHTESDIKIMRLKEDYYLNTLSVYFNK